MEIWLDTCDKQTIAEASQYGFIYGITTNPSILADSHQDPEKVINDLLELQDGPVAVQVTPTNSDEMIQRAKALHAFSDRIIVKVPVIQQGLIAIRALNEEGIPTMATAVFQPAQALLAALAGADYVAPYLGRMFDAGIDAQAALATMIAIYQKHNFKTKILTAAIRTPDQIVACAEMGIHAVTLKSSLFSRFVADDTCTLDSIRAFSEDWESRDYQGSSLLVL